MKRWLLLVFFFHSIFSQEIEKENPHSENFANPYANPESIKAPEDQQKIDFEVPPPIESIKTPLEPSAKPEFWSTGPLLAPSGDIAEFGSVVWQPYLYAFEYYGTYGPNWNSLSTPLFTTISLQPLIRIGIFPYAEFDLAPILNYNHVKGAAQWIWGDIPVNLDFLLLEDTAWYHPNLKFRLSANLPTGAYQRLDALKLGTDIGGSGSWYPGAGIIYYHSAHIYDAHFFATTGYFTYSYATPVHVKGVNTYGGDLTTEGKVHPGNFWEALLSFEYSLSQNWVLALDIDYFHQNKTRFKGSTEEEMTAPSLERFSLAPAIEYCFSENFGIIAGSWFTVAGRNTDQFASGIISIYIVK